MRIGQTNHLNLNEKLPGDQKMMTRARLAMLRKSRPNKADADIVGSAGRRANFFTAKNRRFAIANFLSARRHSANFR